MPRGYQGGYQGRCLPFGGAALSGLYPEMTGARYGHGGAYGGGYGGGFQNSFSGMRNGLRNFFGGGGRSHHGGPFGGSGGYGLGGGRSPRHGVYYGNVSARPQNHFDWSNTYLRY